MTIPALILAGGLGTRIRSITKDRYPKPMLPVKYDGQPYPFLEYLLGHLKSQNVRNIMICIGHLGSQIQEYFGDGHQYGLSITYDDAGAVDTAGRAVSAMRHISSPEVLVLVGDVYHPLRLDGFVQAFTREPEWKMMLSVTTTNSHMSANIKIGDNDDRILAFRADEATGNRIGLDAGTIIMRHDALVPYEAGEKASFTQDIYPSLSEKHQLGAYPNQCPCYEVGSVEGYREFEAIVNRLHITPISLM